MTYDDYRATTRFPALDGLRGIAAAMVIIFHYGGERWGWLSGWIGVHIFFVLSGFLITTLALREEQRRGRLSLGNFYIRRSLRILPVYFVVLALVVGVAWLRGEWESSGLAPLMPYYLTFNGEFVGPGQPHGHVWTLGVEQKFYLVWPLLAFAVVFASRVRLGVSVALLVLLLALCPVHNAFISYVPIVAGCLLAVVLHTRTGFDALAVLMRPATATFVALVFIVIHLAVVEAVAWFGSDGPVILLYSVPVVVLVTSLLGTGPTVWILSTKPMTFLGDRSYSLYLVQGLAGVIAASVVPRFGVLSSSTALAVLVTSLLLADLLYRGVEKPFIGLGRTWTSHRGVACREPEQLGRSVPAKIGS
ncbi:acyltransferase family protein [Pseudonocardia abyssalis]|uniref:Acyltransferase n=1 Tax=Pseudonocardia abyssalis TaxID=2792008 RepID=A0ABS6UY21_9PSEU|nr:acyltransferase [Pseudonocardia abyssalis]MBW0115007.1 acyltransferase [Pseudonocardia abyssalis]MBW0137130.1 acyltransferase [Pseudonocardia abyssalis]